MPFTHDPYSYRTRQDKGIVLILMLVVITVLLFAVFAFMAAIRIQREAGRQFRKASILDLGMMSAMAHAQHVLDAHYIEDPYSAYEFVNKDTDSDGLPQPLSSSAQNWQKEFYDHTKPNEIRIFKSGPLRWIGVDDKGGVWGDQNWANNADGLARICMPQQKTERPILLQCYDRHWNPVPEGDPAVMYTVKYGAVIRDLSGCILANRTVDLSTGAYSADYGSLIDLGLPNNFFTDQPYNNYPTNKFLYPDDLRANGYTFDPHNGTVAGLGYNPGLAMYYMLTAGHHGVPYPYQAQNIVHQSLATQVKWHPFHDNTGNELDEYRDLRNWEEIRAWQLAARTWEAGSFYRFGFLMKKTQTHSPQQDGGGVSAAYTYSFTPFGNTDAYVTNTLNNTSSPSAIPATDPSKVKWEININTAPREAIAMSLIAADEILHRQDANFRYDPSSATTRINQKNPDGGNNRDEWRPVEDGQWYNSAMHIGGFYPYDSVKPPPKHVRFARFQSRNKNKTWDYYEFPDLPNLMYLPAEYNRGETQGATPQNHVRVAYPFIFVKQTAWLMNKGEQGALTLPRDASLMYEDEATAGSIPYADGTTKARDWGYNGLGWENPRGAQLEDFVSCVLDYRPYTPDELLPGGRLRKYDLFYIGSDSLNSKSKVSLWRSPRDEYSGDGQITRYVPWEWDWCGDDDSDYKFWRRKPIYQTPADVPADSKFYDPRIAALLDGDGICGIKWTTKKSRFWHVMVQAIVTSTVDDTPFRVTYEFVYHVDPNLDGDPKDSTILYQHRYGDEQSFDANW